MFEAAKLDVGAWLGNVSVNTYKPGKVILQSMTYGR